MSILVDIWKPVAVVSLVISLATFAHAADEAHQNGEKVQVQDQSVYRIDSQQSSAVMLVYSDGMMAKLGHNHVVDSQHIEGYWQHTSDTDQCRADLAIPLALLRVDDKQLRKAANFTSQPTTSDIEGTYKHMTESVLETDKYPQALIRVSDCVLQGQYYQVHAQLTLHGVTKEQEIAVTLEKDGNAEVVRGKFSLLQTDYGIKPYSAIGGLLRVKNQVDIEFVLKAIPLVADNNQ